MKKRKNLLLERKKSVSERKRKRGREIDGGADCKAGQHKEVAHTARHTINVKK